MIGVILFGLFGVQLVIGVPIAIALGVATMVCMLVMGVPVAVVAQRIFTGLDSTSIMAIPFFVLAGNLMSGGGISRRLVDFVNSIVGKVQGGMAYAMVAACAFFAALSGSAPATVVAIGSMLYPQIVRLGYPKERLAGLLAVSGGLGPIIPPSIIMVVYGTITNCSIGDMFTAGLVAGAMITVVLGVLAVHYSYKENWPKDEGSLDLKVFLKSAFKALPAAFLPVLILGGIYSGIQTPTESAATAVIYSFAVGMFVYREIKPADLYAIIVDSAKSSAMVLFILGTSTAFSWLFTFSGISRALTTSIVALNLTPMLYCFVVAIILLIFGTFLEGAATCILLVPVLWPIAQQLGINVIHFGMIVSISNVIGTMTPPVAVNLFAASSVTGLKMEQIAKGELPFLVGFTLVFFIIVFVPWFSTFFLS